MSLSIQTNVDSINAQENLRVNSNFQSQTIQRLTSGYRINSSADDAAGLAVANEYRSNTAELTQGVRNANDGISTLQIVDGGISNISKMLDRLKNLAAESASGTFSGDRATLNTEYSTLMTEINRQADNIGLGSGNNQYATTIDVYTGGGSSTGNAKVSVDLNNSQVDSATLGLGGTSILGNSLVKISSGTAAVAVAAGNTETFKVNTASGQHTITITGAVGDTIQSQVTNLNGQLSALGIAASLDSSNNLQFSSSDAFSITNTNSVAANGLAANAATTENTGRYTDAATFATGGASVSTLSVTVGSTVANLTIATGLTQDQAVTSINSQLAAAGLTGVSAVADATSATTISFQGSTAFTTSAPTGGMITAMGGVVAPSAASGNASAAITAIDAAVKKLGTVQGKVGTGENTLQYAINLAQSQISSFSAAESRIRDTDVAAEASNLTKAQVLQQASLAALAQANQAPQALLALLKG